MDKTILENALYVGWHEVLAIFIFLQLHRPKRLHDIELGEPGISGN